MNAWQLMRWVWSYATRRWPQLLAAWSMLLCKIGLEVLKPWPLVVLIDYALLGKRYELIPWSIAGTVIVFLLSWAVGLAYAYAGVTLGQRMVYDLAGDLFARLQLLSLSFHRRRSVGDTVRRVTADSSCVSVIIKDALLPLGGAAISLVIMFFVMWRIDTTLTLIALGAVPVMMLAFKLYAQPMMDLSYEQQEVEGTIYSLVEQTASAIPIVQAFQQEPANDQRLHRAHEDTIAATLTLTKVQLKFKLLVGLATALGTAGILWIGAQHALSGAISIGAIIAFLSYLASLYAPLEALMYSASMIESSAGSARRVWEVLQAERDLAEPPGAPPLNVTRGEVEFDHVTFGYEPSHPVLREVSLRATPGETLALVGPTGAGKTTLVSLLPRFFDPWQGAVRIDGHDVRGVQLKSLRQNISIVLQEPFLFPMSVAENIAYGLPAARRPDIEAAARAANAHEFITKLPDGYETVLGDRGATLSGGERQRLSIARALLKNAPILILDEPASALDAETEHKVIEALERLVRGRTTFIIAHRLSTIRNATRVAVLENGRVAECGTHAELLARGGVYARFHALQFPG